MNVAANPQAVGQKFRFRSDRLTETARASARRVGSIGFFFTTGRYSYYRYFGVERIGFDGRLKSHWSASLPSPVSSHNSPWAAVSRSVATPEARVERPAPTPSSMAMVAAMVERAAQERAAQKR